MKEPTITPKMEEVFRLLKHGNTVIIENIPQEEIETIAWYIQFCYGSDLEQDFTETSVKFFIPWLQDLEPKLSDFVARFSMGESYEWEQENPFTDPTENVVTLAALLLATHTNIRVDIFGTSMDNRRMAFPRHKDDGWADDLMNDYKTGNL